MVVIGVATVILMPIIRITNNFNTSNINGTVNVNM